MLRRLRDCVDLNQGDPNPEVVRLLVCGITVTDGVALANYAFYEKRVEDNRETPCALSSTHLLTRV